MDNSIYGVFIPTILITTISSIILSKQFKNEKKAFFTGFSINIIYTIIGSFIASTSRGYGELIVVIFVVFVLSCTQILINLIIASVKYYKRKKTAN